MRKVFDKFDDHNDDLSNLGRVAVSDIEIMLHRSPLRQLKIYIGFADTIYKINHCMMCLSASCRHFDSIKIAKE